MNDDNAHTANALGARGTDTIFAQHFQHGRASHTHDNGQRNGAQHDGGQNHMHHGVFEITRLAPNQRVDQHETGERHAVIKEYRIAYSPRYGREIELHRDQHDQHDPPPEDRHRIAGERDTHRRVVEDRSAFHRRQYPNRNTHDHREQHGANAQFQRRFKAWHELLPDRNTAF